jgi:enoyl-CoA hydratase/carnithine racemase
VPEACSSWFLPRAVGIAQALEWTLTGRLFDATEARDGGLVSRVLAPEDLLTAAHTLAHEIADHAAPVSVALTRQMMWRMLGAAHPMEAHRVDSRAMFSRGASADAREGVTAFLEKRPADFPDRVSRDLPPFFPWWQEPPWE